MAAVLMRKGMPGDAGICDRAGLNDHPNFTVFGGLKTAATILKPSLAGFPMRANRETDSRSLTFDDDMNILPPV